jgi:hypothetical protein
MDVMEKETQAAETAAVDPGRAGATGFGGSGDAKLATEAPLLTKEDLRLVGQTLNGKHWQTDIATLIGCSKSQITRYLNGERDLNPLVSRHLQYVLVERVQQIVGLLNVAGMPYAGSPVAQEVIEAVNRALVAVPGAEPPRGR